MIKIEKINDVYIRVTSDDNGILQEISQFFSFEMPGARFTPQYRAKLWDGIIRLYDLHRKTLYVGLLSYLQNFAERNEYEIEYVNEVCSNTTIDICYYKRIQSCSKSICRVAYLTIRPVVCEGAISG